MSRINVAVRGWFRIHVEQSSSLHQQCFGWANSLNSLCEQPLAPLHPFSSLQSNFIRGEIRLHLTSNDAIWEAEERGFCTTLFYLIVSIWRKEGEQSRGRGGSVKHDNSISESNVLSHAARHRSYPTLSDDVQLFRPPFFFLPLHPFLSL